MSPEQSRKLGHYYETFRKDLLRFAHSKVKAWGEAEDLVQRTFVIACTKADALDNIGNPKAWLTKILFGEIKNYWRTAETHKSYIEEINSDNEYEAPVQDTLLSYLDYIKPAGLSEEDFQIIKYITVYGFTCEEAAKILGISKAACSKRFQRAKKKLKKFF